MPTTSNNNNNDTDAACCVCGKNGKRCSGCKSVFYCGLACQKADWKEHKKFCFLPGSKCTRCMEIIQPGTLCKVPHPPHLVQSGMSIMGGEALGLPGTSFSFRCDACNKEFGKVAKENVAMMRPIQEAKFTYDPPSAEWCYHGAHTIKPLAANDHRKIEKGTIALEVSASTQNQINCYNGDASIRRFILKAKNGMGNPNASGPGFNIQLVNLVEMRLDNAPMSTIILTKDTTPNLKTLYMDYVPYDCNVHIECKHLKEVNLRYLEDNRRYAAGRTNKIGTWVQKLLDSAKNSLVKFECYKLGVYKLHFEGSKLRTIRLERSHYLEKVELDTPRLETFDMICCTKLKACPAFQDLCILENPDTEDPSSIAVDTKDTHLSPKVLSIVKNHPRIRWSGEWLTKERIAHMEDFFRRRPNNIDPEECKQM